MQIWTIGTNFFFNHLWDLLDKPPDYFQLLFFNPKVSAATFFPRNVHHNRSLPKNVYFFQIKKSAARAAYVHIVNVLCESRTCVSKAQSLKKWNQLFQIQRCNHDKGEELCLFRPPLFTSLHYCSRFNVVVVVGFFRRTPWQKRAVIAGSIAARLGPP